MQKIKMVQHKAASYRFVTVHIQSMLRQLKWESFEPGAYEPPKAAKEHATYAVRRVPSQSKFKTHYYMICFLIIMEA